MGGLYARLQEIIGEKIFRHKVTFDGDVVFKKHITAYAPVAGEPSLGTPHPHFALLYAANPAVTTVITIDCTAWMPVGTTWLDYILGVASTTVGDYVTITDAAGTAVYDYNQVQVANNTIYIAGGCPIDSARCVYFVVNNARVTGVEIRSKKYYA